MYVHAVSPYGVAVAVGSLAFVEKVKSEPGIKALHRELEQREAIKIARGGDRCP
jgi:hypothetical protein